MDNKDLISKRELLQLTGISYGQLYRWKRENLIPEVWFMKQSSYTGQETFFPRDRILKRISLILEYKDKYSLEQIASLIYPDRAKRMLTSEDILEVRGIKERIVSVFERVTGTQVFQFSEIRFMYVLSAIEDDLTKNGIKIEHAVRSMHSWRASANNTYHTLLVLKNKDVTLLVLHSIDANVLFDCDTKVIASYDIEKILEGFDADFLT